MLDLWGARKLLAATSGTLIIVSYVVCIGLAVGTYIGGLKFPYFSDTGREAPGYYVFASLNSVASILLLGFVILQYKFVKAWTDDAKCRNVTATVFGAIAPVFSIILSVVSSNTNDDVHFYSAILFFVCMVLHLGFSMTIYWYLNSVYDAFKSMHVARVVVAALFFISFLLYLPIGLAINCPFENLSLDDCINQEDLGVEYCTDLKDPDNVTLTVLYDYSPCVDTNHLRSATQFCSIFFLMVWIIISAFDPTPPTSGTGDERVKFDNTEETFDKSNA